MRAALSVGPFYLPLYLFSTHARCILCVHCEQMGRCHSPEALREWLTRSLPHSPALRAKKKAGAVQTASATFPTCRANYRVSIIAQKTSSAMGCVSCLAQAAGIFPPRAARTRLNIIRLSVIAFLHQRSARSANCVDLLLSCNCLLDSVHLGWNLTCAQSDDANYTDTICIYFARLNKIYCVDQKYLHLPIYLYI